jgi:hypothetical protein
MYPEDFVEEVREEFRDREDIVNMAVDGLHVLGSFLAREARACLDPEDVVDAFEAGEPEMVLSAARRAVRRRKLHRRWLQFMLETVAHPEPARLEEARAQKA